MMRQSLSYAFDEHGNTVAFLGDKALVGGSDFAAVVKEANEHVEALTQEETLQREAQQRLEATHIVTPNGERGTILGHTQGLWSDEITVRLDNGQIRRFATYIGDGLEYQTEQAKPPESPAEYFKSKLASDYNTDLAGLTKRLALLENVRQDAANLIAQHKTAAIEQLHEIVLLANAERNDIKAAIAFIEQSNAEAFAPPKQAYQAVAQADLGHSGSDNWLDVVAHEMIAESENQDFDKLLREGPTVFVAKLDSGIVGDAGVVRDLAQNFIYERTAGFKGEEVDEFRKQFVANVEVARKKDFQYRRDEAAEQQKRVASETEHAPDEALFF
jgi:hypothetical protein